MKKSDYLPRPSRICSTKNEKYKYTKSQFIITWSIEWWPIDILLMFLNHSTFRGTFEKSNILNIGLLFESKIYYAFKALKYWETPFSVMLCTGFDIRVNIHSLMIRKINKVNSTICRTSLSWFFLSEDCEWVIVV